MNLGWGGGSLSDSTSVGAGFKGFGSVVISSGIPIKTHSGKF